LVNRDTASVADTPNGDNLPRPIADGANNRVAEKPSSLARWAYQSVSEGGHNLLLIDRHLGLWLPLRLWLGRYGGMTIVLFFCCSFARW
jgi:hypothetical protein